MKNKYAYSHLIYMQYPFPNDSRPKMSMHDRAAQFAPFAALTGYDESIKEEARITDQKIELSEDKKVCIDQTLVIIQENIKDKPKVKIEYFIPDQTKAGGRYETVELNIKKIDDVFKEIVSTENFKINILDILNIEILK